MRYNNFVGPVLPVFGVRKDPLTASFSALKADNEDRFLTFRALGLTVPVTCVILSRAAKDAENILIYVRNILALIEEGMRAVLVQEEVRNHGEQV